MFPQIFLYELKQRVKGFHSFWVARDIVKEAIVSRHDVHASGKAIMLSQFCPWKKHLSLLEADAEFKQISSGEVLYCLFPSNDGSVRVQCVSKEEGSFENRKSLQTVHNLSINWYLWWFLCFLWRN